MSKTHQAHISAYGIALVIDPAASKYNYNKVMSIVTHKIKNT